MLSAGGGLARSLFWKELFEALSQNLAGPNSGVVGTALNQPSGGLLEDQQDAVRLAVVDESDRLLVAGGESGRSPQDVVGCRPFV